MLRRMLSVDPEDRKNINFYLEEDPLIKGFFEIYKLIHDCINDKYQLKFAAQNSYNIYQLSLLCNHDMFNKIKEKNNNNTDNTNNNNNNNYKIDCCYEFLVYCIILCCFFTCFLFAL
jgi:hypothetical protein